MRKKFEMSQEDMDALLAVMKPVPMIMLQCGSPPSPQERANAAWMQLGETMGFDGMTVKPEGSNPRVFTAVEALNPPSAGGE